jgi:polygalacturonase
MTPAYFIGKGYTSGLKSSEDVSLDDFKFVNTTFENGGGHIYIDGGKAALTNFVFENCTFGKATRPGMLMGSKVAPILFKNVKMNGTVLRKGDQLARGGYEVFVPVKFEP